MCNCPGTTPRFTLKRNTLWNSLSIKFPYPIVGLGIKIDFKNVATGAVVKSITDTGSVTGSYILRDDLMNTIYPILDPVDASLFTINTLYAFDVAFTSAGEIVHRSGILELTAVDGVTA